MTAFSELTLSGSLRRPRASFVTRNMPRCHGEVGGCVVLLGFGLPPPRRYQYYGYYVHRAHASVFLRSAVGPGTTQIHLRSIEMQTEQKKLVVYRYLNSGGFSAYLSLCFHRENASESVFQFFVFFSPAETVPLRSSRLFCSGVFLPLAPFVFLIYINKKQVLP